MLTLPSEQGRYLTTALMTTSVINPDRRNYELGRLLLAALLGAILGGLVALFLAVKFGIGV
jgi:hypothetical protein